MIKKLAILLMILAMVSLANATIIDLVPYDIGQSGGRLGGVNDPLRPSDVIGLKIVLNYQSHPGTNYYGEPTAYKGYVLAVMDLGLHVTGPGTMDALQKTYTDASGYTLYHNTGLLPFGYGDNGTFADGIDEIVGVSASGLVAASGGTQLVWNLLLHCDGYGLVNLDLALVFGAYKPYEDSLEYLYMIEADLGDLVIYQIPEPITLSLLGLGGLFLRRRK